MEKTYRITMSENLWQYCAHIGNGSIVKGLVNIVTNYKAEDPDYATEAIAMQERINDAPTQTADANPIADILADLDKQTRDLAVETGKVQVVEKGVCTLYELSQYNYVLTGDTKPIKDTIGNMGASFQNSFNKLNGASGWRIPKTAIDKVGGVSAFIEMFASVCAINLGESLYTLEEQERDAERAKAKAEKENKPKTEKPKESKPKAEKPSIAPTQAQFESKPKAEKPEPSMVCDLTNWNQTLLNVHLYDTDRSGKAIKSEGTVQITPQSQWLYFRKNDKGKYLIYVHVGQNNLMLVGQTTAEVEKGAPLPANKSTWELIAQKGLATAINEGLVKGAKAYQIDAYKAGGSGEDFITWLQQHAA